MQQMTYFFDLYSSSISLSLCNDWEHVIESRRREMMCRAAGDDAALQREEVAMEIMVMIGFIIMR